MIWTTDALAALHPHDELETYFSRTPTYWGTDLQRPVVLFSQG